MRFSVIIILILLIAGTAQGAKPVAVVNGETINQADYDLAARRIPTPPAGTTDPTPGNNTASDTDTVLGADLSITKSDGVTAVTSGGTTVYTVVVSNLGPSAANGAVVVRPMMYLALSYDHRAIDGKEAVTFLVKVKEGIENPKTLPIDF